MSLLIHELAGEHLFYEKCAKLFALYTNVRFGSDADPVEYYLHSLENRYFRWSIKYHTTAPNRPYSLSVYNGKVVDGRHTTGDFLLNAALFCVRSLLSVVHGEHIGYGTVPELTPECSSRLNEATQSAIQAGIIPQGSTPEDYIRMLMKSYDDIIGFGPYSVFDRYSQNACVIAFYYKEKLEVHAPTKPVPIPNYSFYADNICPYYLNPETDPYLSPYNHGAYFQKNPNKVDLDNPARRHEDILATFTLAKKLRLDVEKNHLSRYWDREETIDKYGWPKLGGDMISNDLISDDVKYIIDNTKLRDVVIDLWYASLYSTLNAVIKQSDKTFLESTDLVDIQADVEKGFNLLDKIYRDSGITNRWGIE